jgi:hypothetical protein
VVIRERDLRDLHRDRVGRTAWRLILSRILTAISALGVTREISPDVHFQALAHTRSPSTCRKQRRPRALWQRLPSCSAFGEHSTATPELADPKRRGGDWTQAVASLLP